ncbi:chromosome partitioning protein ParB [Bacteroidia bacterium]|nr:chromosome partitioning protein ParB [Bacteroidia bacterium]
MKINLRFPEVVDMSLLVANDYNPNRMPKKEMALLKECITKYGFLFPIIVNKEGERYVIIDGFHRYKALSDMHVEKVSVVNMDIPVSERMKLTVLMNRIKGMHQVEDMSELVVKLNNLGVPDVEIAKELGMEPEEYIRLKQQLGIAAYYRNHNYSNSWEVE